MTPDPLGAASSSRRPGLSCRQLHQRGLYAVTIIVLCSVSYTFRNNQPLEILDRALGSTSPVSSSLSSDILRSSATTITARATSEQLTTIDEVLTALNVPTVSAVAAPKLGVSPSEEAYCRHGGLELDNGGCICGRGTQGLRCQTVNASLLTRVQDYAVCGPECWGMYAWAPPKSLNFRPLKQAKADGDDRSDYYEAKLLNFLVWLDGGEVRLPNPTGISNSSSRSSSSSSSSRSSHLVTVPDTWTSLGPWSAVDKQMLATFQRYRQHAVQRSAVVPRSVEKSSMGKDEEKKKQTATIVFGLMLHDDVSKFQAQWQALFSEDHYYIIHLDKHLEGKNASLPATGTAGAAAAIAEAEAQKAKDSQRREGILAIIAATPLSSSTALVWDRVHMVEEAASIDSLWGDITLVYTEILLWLRLNQQLAHWKWDYFINLSGSDIPVVSLDAITEYFQPYLATAEAPAACGTGSTSWISSHNNTNEFRQTYVLPEKEAHKFVIAFNLRQNETNFGKYRARVKMTRLLGCSQWHVLHRTMLERLVSTPEVEGLLYSMKHTSIPDESFFATAAQWLVERYPEELSLRPKDLRYVNEIRHRNLTAKGELRNIMLEARRRDVLFARKSNSAIITCAYTNRLMGLNHDCSAFNSTGVFPQDALYDDPPPRPADVQNWE